MTHEEARSLMWEDDLTQDFHAHIEGCDECRSEYEKIKKIKETLAEKDNISSGVMAKIRIEKRRTLLRRALPVACALAVVAASAIFIKANNKKDVRDKLTESTNLSLSYTSEELTVGTTDIKDGASDVVTSLDDPASPPESALPEVPAVEPSAPEDNKDAPEHDLYMLLSVYKDSLLLSYHTSDIIVIGSDVEAALEALASLGAVAVEKHIEIDGDSYFEAQQALQDAGFEIALVSSSESISKTLIFFSDYLI